MECLCDKRKVRNEEEYRTLKNRLSRIEGQVRGIGKMLDESAYCIDILTQVSAVQAAISAFARELLGSHIRECVTEDIKSGKSETVDELLETISRLMR